MTYFTVLFAATGTDCIENIIPLLLFMSHSIVTASCSDSTILALSEYAAVLWDKG
jgi:hypothetical protein